MMEIFLSVFQYGCIVVGVFCLVWAGYARGRGDGVLEAYTLSKEVYDKLRAYTALLQDELRDARRKLDLYEMTFGELESVQEQNDE